MPRDKHQLNSIKIEHGTNEITWIPTINHQMKILHASLNQLMTAA
jgi:hypothetical protein